MYTLLFSCCPCQRASLSNKVYKKVVKFSFKQQKIFWVFSNQYLYLLFGLSNPEIKNCPILGLLHSCFNSASLSLLQSCLHEKIRIVVQTFRIRFRGAAAAHAPKPGKTPIMSAQSRCRLLFFKMKVRHRSCRLYLILMAPLRFFRLFKILQLIVIKYQ